MRLAFFAGVRLEARALLAKALDEQKHVLVYSILPFAYDSSDVWQARGVPLALGAERYYKEKGYLLRNAN